MLEIDIHKIYHKHATACPHCDINSSDSMIQPQMDQDWYGNISNLVLVEPNRIRDSIYACIRLLFANFVMLKM